MKVSKTEGTLSEAANSIDAEESGREVYKPRQEVQKNESIPIVANTIGPWNKEQIQVIEAAMSFDQQRALRALGILYW